MAAQLKAGNQTQPGEMPLMVYHLQITTAKATITEMNLPVKVNLSYSSLYFRLVVNLMYSVWKVVFKSLTDIPSDVEHKPLPLIFEET